MNAVSLVNQACKRLVWSSASHAVADDGDSLTFGFGVSSGFKQSDLLISDSQSPLFGSGIVVGNSGVNGDTLQGMLSTIPSYSAGKTNFLVSWAGTNDIANGNKTAAQTLADLQTYVTAVKAANAGWRVIFVTTLPRQAFNGAWASIDLLNAELKAFDDLVRANYKTIGIERIVDLRQPGSPFALATFTEGAFAAAQPYWYETTAGTRVHLSDAGAVLVNRMVQEVFRRLRP